MWGPQEPQALMEFSHLTMVPFGRVDERWFRQGCSEHCFSFFSWKAEEFEVQFFLKKTRLTDLSWTHCEDKSLMTKVRCILISGSFFLKSRHFDTETSSVSAFCSFTAPVCRSMTGETGRVTFRCWQAVISQACAQRAAYSHINFFHVLVLTHVMW